MAEDKSPGSSGVDHRSEKEKEPAVRIYGSEGLSGRVALFNNKSNSHQSAQKANPFSGAWQGTGPLNRQDANYGRPVQGSKTEYRGKKAGELVSNEIKLLCDMIWEFGQRQPDDTALISFGELFEIYVRISNKLVGTLLRARKHGLLTFKGEMLFQRRDDNVIIALLMPIQEIRKASGASIMVDARKPASDSAQGTSQSSSAGTDAIGSIGN